MINDKLKTYSRYLIELKLTTFNGDQNKSKVITNSLLNDDFMNLKQTLTDIQQFEKKVANLSGQYHEINDLFGKYKIFVSATAQVFSSSEGLRHDSGI